MGRYYDGDIIGKFAFGLQHSDDASYFGVHQEQRVEYFPCSCDYDGTPYCTKCYHSLEEHVNASRKELGDVSDEQLVGEDSYIYYNFRKEHIHMVRFYLEKVERNVPQKYRDGVTFDPEQNFQYKITNYENSDSKFFWRWLIGKQILLCLEKNGKCSFRAEY